MVKGFNDTIEWYNQNAVKYADAIANKASLDQLEDFVEALFSGAKILDAGCGSGRDSNLLKKKGLLPVGLDISSGLVAEAKKRYPEIEFIEGSFLKIPYRDEEFDGVWAHASLLHLETVGDVKLALREFHRVLKSYGVVHVLVKAQTGKDKTAVVTDAVSEHDRFFQYFSEEELKRLMTETGYEELKFEKYNEAQKEKGGRPEVEWLYYLGKKS